MKYALLFAETSEQFEQRDGEGAPQYWGAWSHYINELAESGVLIPGAGSGLLPPQSATTVRGALIQDGTCMEAKEQLGGFVLIEVSDLDEAIRWAKKAPCAEHGAVEIRPAMPDPEA